MAHDWSAIFDVILMGSHFVPPEDRQTQVENSSKTENTTAGYSSGF